MSEDIRKMIDKLKNFNNSLNEGINGGFKPEIDVIYNEHSELNNLGTKEQYYQYLNTIFPESKIKEIVYHSSPNKFEEFEERFFGAYFSYSPLKYSYGGNIHKCLIDVKKPLIMPKSSDSPETKELYFKEYRNYLYDNKYDGSIETSSVTPEGKQVRVKSPEQIHILGSKKDVEGFKNFVKK
jgi:hypothetical protein